MDEAGAAGQVAQDPEASADGFMYANDTITTLTDAKALAKIGGIYRDEIESTNSQEILDTLTVDDNLYGVPYTTNTWFMFYDCTLFGDGTDESAGVDFSGQKAVDVTDYLIDLESNPNFKIDQDGSGIAGIRDGSINACSQVPGM